MKRSAAITLTFIVILIFTLRAVYGSGITLAFASANPAMPVRVIYAKKTAAVKNITSPGKIISNGRQVFISPFTGRLIESFTFPKFVAAGTVIARVVSPGLYAKIISARTAVKYAKTKFKREKLLFRYGVAAKKDVELAALNLSGAYSSLRALESLNGEGTLISRFNGTVHYLMADGAIVAAGSAVAVLNGKGMPWIRTYVTPSQSLNLYDNMRVEIKRSRIREEGGIISIGGNAAHNGLVPVYVSLPENSPLLPGEWVNLSFIGRSVSAFSLPEKAVIMRKGRTFVFAVRRNKAQAVKIKVIRRKSGKFYVEGNIRAGEPIIIYPVTRLISGISVEIKR